MTAALAAGLLMALPASLYFLRAPEEKLQIRFEMPVQGVTDAPAISPDGQLVAYAAQNEGKTAIWIRPIGELTSRPLPGTEKGTSPFWSPDEGNDPRNLFAIQPCFCSTQLGLYHLAENRSTFSFTAGHISRNGGRTWRCAPKRLPNLRMERGCAQHQPQHFESRRRWARAERLRVAHALRLGLRPRS